MSEMVRVHAMRRFGTTSPLRYPGGKSALAGLLADVIDGLDISRPIYVEPYAGGAGAGVALLREGVVQRLVINDFDSAVHAFWHSAVHENRRLLDWVATVPVTLPEWHRQRDIYRAGTQAGDLFELGCAFFFLNRTNRSGVLNAGVIGGQKQAGRYLIDARFNRDTLIERLAAIGELSEAIEVSDLDGRSVIRRYASQRSAFMYIDPPYVQAGSQLYLNAFDARDHEALAAIVNKIGRARWLMTYDVADSIKRLYAAHFQCVLDLTYSARYPGSAQELLIAPQEVAQVLRALDQAATAAVGA
jgi:DNA adenine methylase